MNFFMTNTTDRHNIKPMLRFIAMMMVMVSLIVTEATRLCVYARHITFFNGVRYLCFGFTSFWMIISVVFLDGSPFCAFSIFTVELAVFFRSSIFPYILLTFWSLAIYLFSSLVFITIMVAFSCQYSFFGFTILLLVDFTTTPALTLKPIFATIRFIKLRNMLNLLASATLFCYDGFRHGFFLVKKLCLEPFVGHSPAYGLFYFNTFLGGVK